MYRVKYKSTEIQYKSPFGAAVTNEEIRFSFYVDTKEAPLAVRFVYRKDEEKLLTKYTMPLQLKIDNELCFSCSISFEEVGLYFYRFEVETKEGILFCGLKDGEAVVGDWLPEWQLTVYDENFKTPAWVKGGIMYQIFPDRFNRSDHFQPLPAKNDRQIREDWMGTPQFIYDTPDYKANDFFCGNLDGIIEKLDYLKSLGITILYLNPVFESPENHRYSTGDYYHIDPYLGTNEDFERLTKECEKRDIAVILDGVFSHTGADSIYFNKCNHYESVGAYNSIQSPYYNWYNFITFPEKYECWWNFINLPNVNECEPDYLKFITGKKDGVLNFWQSKGCKGWRLDVSDELPDPFLDQVRKSVKEFDADAFIIGEVWEDATNKCSYDLRRRYLLGEQLDSVMNYPWRTAMIDFVMHGDAKLFENRILCILENYPLPVINALMNLLSTHDTARTINIFGAKHQVLAGEKGAYRLTQAEYDLGKERLMMAAFLQFTLPGIPCIYYGDEVGLSGFEDPYCRMGYPYGREDLSLLRFYRSLAEIRTQNKECFAGSFSLLYAQENTFLFKRENLLCYINVGEHLQHIDIEITGDVIFTNDAMKIDRGITIPPKTFGIVK